MVPADDKLAFLRPPTATMVRLGGTMGGHYYYGKGWPLPAHCSDLDQSPAGLHLFVSLCIYVCTIHTILGIERVVCMLFQ